MVNAAAVNPQPWQASLTALVRQVPIRQRLIAAFALVSLLPLLIAAYLFYDAWMTSAQRGIGLFNVELSKQVAQNVHVQMARFETDSEALVLSDPVQDALAAYTGADPAAQGRARAALTKQLIDHYGSFEEVGQKYFLDRHNHILDPQAFAQFSQSVERYALARQDSTGGGGDGRGRPSWGKLRLWAGQDSIVMARQIYFKSDNRLAGSLLLGIRPAHFSHIFNDVHLGTGSAMFVADGRDGTRLISADPALAGTPMAPALAAGIATLARNGHQSGYFLYRETAPDGSPGASVLAAASRVPDTGWYVVSTMPRQALANQLQPVRRQVLLIGVVCFGCAVALAGLIAHSISAPLEQLAGVMRDSDGGKLAHRLEPDGRDELAQVARKFNEMAGAIGQAHGQLEQRVAARTRELEQVNRQLAALSLTDGLTGIANRRHFDAALDTELQRAARSGKPLALLMLDVDHFKRYNDHYGHQEGDACLRRVATLLQAHARRAGDLAARYGGEEFVWLAADTDGASALRLAEALRADLAARALPHSQAPLGRITISVGVAALAADAGGGAVALIAAADKAMYRAKEQGRNQVQLAEV